MKSSTIFLSLAFSLFFSACRNKENAFDASGAFEADETIISAQAGGVIKQLTLEEGQALRKGQEIGYIDSLPLYLKKKQLEAQIKALLSKKPDVALQLSALQEQLKTAQHEQERVAALVKSDAATTKQLDDVNAGIELLKRQIAAQKSNLEITSNGIGNDAEPLQVQVEQIEDQLQKCKLINPVNGTVLNKYAVANEMTAPGKPIYKIADLSVLILRAYVSGDQLPGLTLNQPVEVNTDDGNGGFKKTVGRIIWISDKAEFTPKTIQTKNERANLVYAIKVSVKNDGFYKIGMYGEIKF